MDSPSTRSAARTRPRAISTTSLRAVTTRTRTGARPGPPRGARPEPAGTTGGPSLDHLAAMRAARRERGERCAKCRLEGHAFDRLIRRYRRRLVGRSAIGTQPPAHPIGRAWHLDLAPLLSPAILLRLARRVAVMRQGVSFCELVNSHGVALSVYWVSRENQPWAPAICGAAWPSSFSHRTPPRVRDLHRA